MPLLEENASLSAVTPVSTEHTKQRTHIILNATSKTSPQHCKILPGEIQWELYNFPVSSLHKPLSVFMDGTLLLLPVNPITFCHTGKMQF